MNPEMLFGIAVYLGIAALISLIVAAVHAVQWLQELTERTHYLERMLEPQMLRYELEQLLEEQREPAATITFHDHSRTPRVELFDQDAPHGIRRTTPAGLPNVWADLEDPSEEV